MYEPARVVSRNPDNNNEKGLFNHASGDFLSTLIGFSLEPITPDHDTIPVEMIACNWKTLSAGHLHQFRHLERATHFKKRTGFGD